MRIHLILLFLIASALVLPKAAYAYVDPVTGSFIVQLVVGFFLGGWYVIKKYYGKIKELFLSVFSSRTGHE